MENMSLDSILVMYIKKAAMNSFGEDNRGNLNMNWILGAIRGLPSVF